MPKCKGCGAEIIWIRTEKGRPMPLDAKPVKGYKLIGGESERYHILTDFHLPHWGTCKKFKMFKKNNKVG